MTNGREKISWDSISKYQLSFIKKCILCRIYSKNDVKALKKFYKWKIKV